MGYIRMVIALAITVLIIVKVHKKRDWIVPVCTFYFLCMCVNDIFNAGSPIQLAYAMGISYQLGDTLFVIFTGVLILDLVQCPMIRRNCSNALLGIITLLLAVSCVSGLISYGSSAGWMGDLRSIGLFFSAILYFAKYFKPAYLQKHRKIIDAVMWIILGISVVLWVIDIGFGLHPLRSQYNATLSDGGSTMRFVQSYEVLVIALYAICLVKRDIREKGIIGFKAIIFILGVILFQHRSVWFALGAGIAVIIGEEIIHGKITTKLFGQIILFVVFGVFLIFFGTGNLMDNIRNGFELLEKITLGDSLENTTANTRNRVWQAVMNDLQGVYSVIGRPFGHGYGRSIGWSTSPHSGYIRMLGRTGWVGLYSLIILMLYIAINLIKQHRVFGLELLVCVTAFMYGYDFTWACGVVIGACISTISNATDVDA